MIEEMGHCSLHNKQKPCPVCRANRHIVSEGAKHTIAAVVAIGRNRELGKGNELLWHIPDDLKRFKRLTMGHPIIFGRKTFESLPKRPLPGRANIVVTRDADWKHEGVLVVGSLEKAIELAKQQPGAEGIHIGGGAQIYEQALPLITKLYLTLVDAEVSDADTFFPAYESEFTKKTFEGEREWEGLKYRWVDAERA